jgi:ABC-type glycerol-3-phosphate transport system substrate-binding protein
MKKMLSVVVLVLLCVAGWANAQETKRLTVWILPPSTSRGIEAELKAFQDANPNIAVTFVLKNWDTVLDDIEQAARGSAAAPDLLQIGSSWVSAIAAQGVLHTFTSEQLSGFATGDSFFESALAAGTNADGNIVAVPFVLDSRAFIYREDIFRRLNINPTTAFSSIENLIAALETIKAADLKTPDGRSIYPIILPGETNRDIVHSIAPFVWASGGEFLAEDGTVNINSAEVANGVGLYVGLYAKGLTQPNMPSTNFDDALKLFGDRQGAVALSGSWMIRTIRETTLAEETDIDAAILAGQPTFLGGSHIGIWDASPNKAEALTLLAYLTSREFQLNYNLNVGMLPATQGAFNASAFQTDEDFKVFAQAVALGRSYPVSAVWQEVEGVLTEGFGSIVRGAAGKSEADLLSALAGQLEELAGKVAAVLE